MKWDSILSHDTSWRILAGLFACLLLIYRLDFFTQILWQNSQSIIPTNMGNAHNNYEWLVPLYVVLLAVGFLAVGICHKIMFFRKILSYLLKIFLFNFLLILFLWALPTFFDIFHWWKIEVYIPVIIVGVLSLLLLYFEEARDFIGNLLVLSLMALCSSIFLLICGNS